MVWRAFENGATIGQRGSEDGVILRDEEHDAGARLTLERDCSHGVPFAMTCGIYVWFFHKCFLLLVVEGDIPAMLDGLSQLMDIIPCEDAPDRDVKLPVVNEAISDFVNRFP